VKKQDMADCQTVNVKGQGHQHTVSLQRSCKYVHVYKACAIPAKKIIC